MGKTKVAFVGLGYIGLPTAVVMANNGIEVIGVDVITEKIEKINRGEITIVEPGLEEQLKIALSTGRFKATTTMPKANTYIIAVPTPFMENRDVDMKYIYSAVDAISAQLEGDELIVLESTSPPLTTERMAKRVLEKRPDLVADGSNNPENKPIIYFAHCPERILPGNAMEELKTNDRIIGGMTPEATHRAKEIYSTFCTGDLLSTNDRTAELAKLTENSFRDVNIAFANELSLICDKLNIDVWELISLANHHPRVNILQPGPGVGGHCIAVDPWFIVSSDPDNAQLIRMAREINDAKPKYVVDKILAEAARLGGEPRIAILGLAFKADIDDLRESPAMKITEEISELLPKSHISVVEPNILALPTSIATRENIEKTTTETALSTSEMIVVLVDHREFKEVSPSAIIGKKIIDTRGIWTPGFFNR